MRIAIASSSLLAVPILEALSAANERVVAIITTPDAPQGRGRILTPSDLAQWASESSYQLYKYDEDSISEFLARNEIELVITLSFGKLIRSAALATPTYGWLNIHFSQLPRWRGAAPVQRALLAGDTQIGISIFALDAGMDTGPVYLMTNQEIGEEATTEQLLTELSKVAAEEIVPVLKKIRSGERPEPQSQTGLCHAEKISPTLGKIDWNTSGLTILRLDRALGGNVGIFTSFRGAKLNLRGVRIRPQNEIQALPPGSPYLTGEKNQDLTIAASDSLVEFSYVKPAGKTEMKSADFLRGARILPEERFL